MNGLWYVAQLSGGARHWLSRALLPAIPASDYLILLDVLNPCPQRDRIEQDREALPGGRQPALWAPPSSASPRARGGGLHAMLQNLPKRTHPWQSAEKLPDNVIFDLACDTPRTQPGPEGAFGRAGDGSRRGLTFFRRKN